jgi:hypothetical protein
MGRFIAAIPNHREALSLRSDRNNHRLLAEGLKKIMSKNPPDWWARGGALAGIGLSIIGLVLTYRSYHWQQQVYQESLEERVLVRTMAWITLKMDKDYEGVVPTEPEGTLGVEVVNIGMRPLYLKSVTAKIGNSILTFYERDPL